MAEKSSVKRATVYLSRPATLEQELLHDAFNEVASRRMASDFVWRLCIAGWNETMHAMDPATRARTLLAYGLSAEFIQAVDAAIPVPVIAAYPSAGVSTPATPIGADASVGRAVEKKAVPPSPLEEIARNTAASTLGLVSAGGGLS